MNDKIIKIIMVIDGKYKVVTKNYEDSKECKKILANLSNYSYLNELMQRYINKNNLIVPHNQELNVLCLNCANMLKCPKVLDKEKRTLKKYPFITYGIESILVDKDANKLYNDALLEYRKRLGDGDESVYSDLSLNQRLVDTGYNIKNICVYGCKKFVDDKDVEVKKKEEYKTLVKESKKKTFTNKGDQSKQKPALTVADIIKYFNF